MEGSNRLLRQANSGQNPRRTNVPHHQSRTLEHGPHRTPSRCSTASLRNSASFPTCSASFALSPAAFGGLLSLNAALSKSLDAKTRERIAIAVAQVNACDYCLSAHTYIGVKLAKITPEDAALNRKGASTDAKADAAVRFAAKVAEQRGQVSDTDIAAVKAAGFSEAQIVEIVGHVALRT